LPPSASNDPWHQDYLRDLGVKLPQPLDRLAWVDAKSRGAPGALACKDAFGFAQRGQRFSITGQGVLFIPEQAIIPAI
jgi:hypothetical protein